MCWLGQAGLSADGCARLRRSTPGTTATHGASLALPNNTGPRQPQRQQGEQQQAREQQRPFVEADAMARLAASAAASAARRTSVGRCSLRRARWISSGSSSAASAASPAGSRNARFMRTPRRRARRTAAAAAGPAAGRARSSAWRMPLASRRASQRARAPREAREELARASPAPSPSSSSPVSGSRKRWPPLEREVALLRGQHLDRQHFAPRRRQPRRPASTAPSSKQSLSSDHQVAARRCAPTAGAAASLAGQAAAARAAPCSSSSRRSRWRAPAPGATRRTPSPRSADQAEAVALAQRQFGDAGGQRLARRPGATSRARRVVLRHRRAGIDQQPHRQRAFALGLAHEEAVRARVELPVDLAQLVAGLVGAVLRELQPGAAAAAVVQADALHADARDAQVRRRSFSRARTCGGMQSAMRPARTRRLRRRERHAAQQRGDHVVGALLLGFGGERQQQAVAHHRRGQRGDVLARRGQAAVQQRARLGRQHQRLAGARTGAPAHPFAHFRAARRRRDGWRAPGA